MTFWVPARDEKIEGRYQLEAVAEACVGSADRQFFMGGVAFAAAIQALETDCDKPLLWATIQFSSHGMCGDEITIQIDPARGGRTITQSSATLTTHDRILQKVMAALGAREGGFDQQFVSMPDVLPPMQCPEKPLDTFAQPGNLLDQFDRRIAVQDDDLGLEYLWVRPRFETPRSAALLALIADFFLGAHSCTQGGTSLDNTFRIHTAKPTEWVLNAVQLNGIRRGAVSGSILQFAEDGTLLSSGSQTGLLPR
ncbi:MAG: acyl-CoA thioesterase domain-containing protein [Pseudomonadota bacterium]